MPLTALSVRSKIGFTLQKTNTGFPPTTFGPASEGYVYTQPAGANQLYAAEFTIAASGTQTIDLNSFTNLAGESVTGIGAYSLFVMPVGSPITIGPGASDGLNWFWGSGTIPIPDGGELKYSQPAAQTVSSSACNVKLTNTGSGSTVVTIVVVVGQ
jgi:hypothetical protein